MTDEEAIKILSHTTNLGYGVVIEAMEGYTTREIKMALDKSIKALEEERPQGEWIDYDNTFYKCPECGYLLEKCCPQCQTEIILPICHWGSDMRGKADQLRDCENCIHHSDNGCEVWECEFKRRSS